MTSTTMTKMVALWVAALVMVSTIAPSRVTVNAAANEDYAFVFYDGGEFVSIYYADNEPIDSREMSWEGNTLKLVNSGKVVTTNLSSLGTPAWAEQGKYLVWQEPNQTAVILKFDDSKTKKLSNVTAVTLDDKGFVESLTINGSKKSVSEALASESKTTAKETEQAQTTEKTQNTDKIQNTEKAQENSSPQQVATTAPVSPVTNNYYGTVNNDNSSTTNNNYYYGESKKETTSTTSSTSKKVVKVKKTTKLSVKYSKNHKVAKLYKGKKKIATLKISGRKILLGKKVVAKLSKKEASLGLKYKKVAFTNNSKKIIFVTNTGKVFQAKKSSPKKWSKVTAKKISFNKSGFATLA